MSLRGAAQAKAFGATWQSRSYAHRTSIGYEIAALRSQWHKKSISPPPLGPAEWQLSSGLRPPLKKQSRWVGWVTSIKIQHCI